MYHIAIMKKSFGLLPKVISGEKTIESRWYMHKVKPWDAIEKNDTVYFKNSGEPVTVKAKVSNVLQFSDLTPARVKQLLNEYGSQDGLPEKDIPFYLNLFKHKKYCLLVFLTDIKNTKPFQINKKGFGAMSAWLTVKNLNDIKL